MTKPCAKCGGTDRHPPRPGRNVGRCKKCQAQANEARKHNRKESPFECIADGCTRRSRSTRKAGLCNTCYTRRHLGSSPRFPADPLIAYMEARGLGWPGHSKPKPGSTVTLERLDAICIDVLEVHPMQVYGDLYFQECVA